MLRVLIHGAGGRMGRVLLSIMEGMENIEAVAGVDVMGASDLGIPVFRTLNEVNVECDVLIDFSRPDALDDILSFAVERQVGAVLATTGYTAADVARIERAALRVPVFRSANMSLGINLLMELSQKSASFLGESCDIEIVEAHHRMKADAPSGTALMLADAVNEVFDGEKEYMHGRHGRTQKRTHSEIGIHAIRGGSVVGDHTVMFLMDEEKLELSHAAQSRAVFARGAIKAAQFIAGKQPQLYNMHDLLLDKSPVTHVHVEQNIAMITIGSLPQTPSSAAEVFACLASGGIVVDMIGQTFGEHGMALSFSIASEDVKSAEKALSSYVGRAQIQTISPLCKLTVEGLGMERQAGIAARVFELTGRLNVLPHMVSTSPTEISLLIQPDDEFAVANAIGKAFGI